jgi:hypothetical protein
MGGTFEKQIEISCSPTNSDDMSWLSLGQARIRTHMTTADARDVFSHHFPDYLEGELEKRLGKGIAKVILHENLLSEIDPLKHKAIARQWVWGGGVPFVLIAREPHKYPALIQFWIDHPATDNQQLFFLPLIKEHEELMRRPVLDKVPREWLEHYHQIMSRMQPLAPVTDEVGRFLEDNPVETLSFPPPHAIKEDVT